MAKITITLEDHDWGVVFAHLKPVDFVSETVYRSMLEQFNGHVQGKHVSEELALLDLIVAATAAVNHLEKCERGMINHPFKSRSLPMLRQALLHYGRTFGSGEEVPPRDNPVHQHVIDALTEIMAKSGDRTFERMSTSRNFLLLESIWNIARNAKASLEKATCGGEA